MAKKLILLLLLIPIIVMISLFAATKTISIMIDVPVSGITISDSAAYVYLDLDKQETHSLEYTVYPINAHNKEITATAESVNGRPTADLDFKLEDGKVSITPKSTGSAKVSLTTKEGGFSASITVHVESKKALELQSIDCTISKNEIEVGDTAVINTVLNPTDPINPLLYYESDNTMVATVNQKGIVTALRGGVANIKIYADANPNIYKIVTVTVKNKATASISKPDDFSNLSASGYFSFNAPEGITVESLENVKLKAYTTDNQGNVIDLSDKISLSLEATNSNGNIYYTVRYEFTDTAYSGKYSISASYDDGYNSFETKIEDCEKIVKENIDLKLSFDKIDTYVNVNAGSRPAYSFSVSPVTSSECEYSISIGNKSVVSAANVILGTSIQLTALNAGVTDVTLTATLKDDSTVTTSITLKVYVIPCFDNQVDFNITNPLAMGGNDIESIFTLGKYEYNSKAELNPTSQTANALKLSYVFNALDLADPSFAQNITWEVLDGTNNATKAVFVAKNVDQNGNVDGRGLVKFNDETDSFNGMVTVRALFGGRELGTYELRCVANGINVYSYLDLYRATTTTDTHGNYRSVVLRDNVIDDFGTGVEKPYTEITTTYDKTYLENTNSSTKIKVLIAFRANVYGNGFEINADKVTQDTSIFSGPLNFVAMSPTNSGVAVSVKGQDNVCFALYEGVTANNVTLCGSSPVDDLVDLDYRGTVVEIFGDDTAIEYSRIKYGRTVIRAFGDVNDPTKNISVNIKNSILSEAREFIIRTGSNCFVDSEDYQNPSPALDGAGETTHLDKNGYNASAFDREAYDESFIKTDITIEDVVFRNTGLFAIGIDSHFSSKSLADGNYFVNNDLANFSEYAVTLFKISGTNTLIDSWKNLSKTSYGAKIKFKGEVILDTWKPLNDVNSSTLMEIPSEEALNNLLKVFSNVPGVKGFAELSRKINFNVRNMLISYNKSLADDGDTQLIYDSKNNNNYEKDPENDENMCNNSYYSDDYVHGGIVFFGGGKNYGVFDITESTSSLPSLPIFKVTFGEIGPDYDYLKFAAGEEPFFFAMYNASHYGDLHDPENPIPDDDSVIRPK